MTTRAQPGQQDLAGRPIHESLPQPDPTPRTTEQGDKGLLCLREFLEARIDGSNAVRDIRLKGMDRALKIGRKEAGSLRKGLHREVKWSEKLRDEKFKSAEQLQVVRFQAAERLQKERFRGVEMRFSEFNIRTDKIAELNQKALDAALLTAEKAVGKQTEVFSLATAKSDAGTKERLDQLGVIFSQSNRASDERTNSLKERMDRGEGTKKGHGEGWAYLIAAASVMFAGVTALAGVAAVVVVFMVHH
jgi:ribosomal protein L16/L10AE